MFFAVSESTAFFLKLLRGQLILLSYTYSSCTLFSIFVFVYTVNTKEKIKMALKKEKKEEKEENSNVNISCVFLAKNGISYLFYFVTVIKLVRKNNWYIQFKREIVTLLCLTCKFY